jgi:dihydrofolate reductase
MIAAIAAVDNNWGIGYNGNLLASIPEDLKYFKELTNNKVVVMGRKTWDSLPRKPLPNRINFVITRNPKEDYEITLEELKTWLNFTKKDVFIIGGGQIYEELLPFCEKVYITKIYKAFENVDTYFPNLDKNFNWKIVTQKAIQSYNGLNYQFLEYKNLI